jgi:hypothetical protein
MVAASAGQVSGCADELSPGKAGQKTSLRPDFRLVLSGVSGRVVFFFAAFSHSIRWVRGLGGLIGLIGG